MLWEFLDGVVSDIQTGADSNLERRDTLLPKEDEADEKQLIKGTISR